MSITFDPASMDWKATGERFALFMLGATGVSLAFWRWFRKHFRPTTEVLAENTNALTILNASVLNVHNSLSAVHSRLGGIEARAEVADKKVEESNNKLDEVLEALRDHARRLDDHDDEIKRIIGALPQPGALLVVPKKRRAS